MINKRVMIVDDESDVNLVIKMVLEESGFQVDSFTDPLLALENVKLEADKYMLLVLDIRMPNMNGFELYREIKKIDDKVKVCFITAYDVFYEKLKEGFPAVNVGCFIKKPVDINELVSRINRELKE